MALHITNVQEMSSAHHKGMTKELENIVFNQKPSVDLAFFNGLNSLGGFLNYSLGFREKLDYYVQINCFILEIIFLTKIG